MRNTRRAFTRSSRAVQGRSQSAVSCRSHAERAGVKRARKHAIRIELVAQCEEVFRARPQRMDFLGGVIELFAPMRPRVECAHLAPERREVAACTWPPAVRADLAGV